MASIRELLNEHLEVVQRIHTLEQEVGTLVMGQVLKGTEAVMRFPSFIDKAILPHFSIEEKGVFPLLEKGSAQEQSLRDELLADHLSLKESFFHYLMEIQKGKATPELLTMALDIGNRLREHAQKEDAFLIPWLRRWLDIENGQPLPPHAPPIAFSDQETPG